MVRVLLDATAVPADRRGVGRYVDALVPALVDVGVALQVACQARDAEHFAGLGADVHPLAERLAGRAARLVWEQTGLPALVRRLRPDVLHCPHYTMPLIAAATMPLLAAVAGSGTPTVVTVHDATFFSDPELHERVKGPFFRTATRLAVRRAARCIVPSQASADALVAALPHAAGRLTVAHHGVDTEHFAPPAAAAVTDLRRDLELSERPFTAFLGTLEPRKNVPALVSGFARAAASRADDPVLVVAGGAGWDDDIDAAVAEARRTVDVRTPGYLPVDQLPALLGGADVVAYPSLDEGFGLPVLEAMACGAAVLTTRRGPLPEVGGEAVAYCDVDAASIADGLRSLWDDPARRSALGAAGRERAGLFTWRACAEAHAEAYDIAAGQNSVAGR